jgi:hypothetical protein
VNTTTNLDDLQHSTVNRLLRDALAECMPLPHSGIIGLRHQGDLSLHWLAGPTACLAARLSAGYDFAASIKVIATEYTAVRPVSAPGLIGTGLLSTVPGPDANLIAFATLVADTKVHTVRWTAGAAAPTWRIQAQADAAPGTTTGLLALLAALTRKAVS